MLKSMLSFAQGLLPAGTVEERRGTIRQQCQLLVEANNADGETHLSTVADVSPKGLRLEGPAQLARGQIIQVALPKSKSGSVSCQVVWSKAAPKSRNFNSGLVYVDTGQNLAKSWVKDKLLELGFVAGKIDERRKLIRFPTPIAEVVLIDGNGDVIAEGRLANIGYGGALVALATQVPGGTGVRMVIEPHKDLPALDTLAVARFAYRSPQKFHMTGLQFGTPGQSQIKRYVRAVKKATGMST